MHGSNRALFDMCKGLLRHVPQVTPVATSVHPAVHSSVIVPEVPAVRAAMAQLAGVGVTT